MISCASPSLSLFWVFTLPPMFLSPCNFCHCPSLELSVYLLSAISFISSLLSLILKGLCWPSVWLYSPNCCLPIYCPCLSLLQVSSFDFGHTTRTPSPYVLHLKVFHNHLLLVNLTITHIICMFLWQFLIITYKISSLPTLHQPGKVLDLLTL